MKPTLYLIPCPIAEGDPRESIAPEVLDTVRTLRCFVVEQARTARRFLSAVGMPVPITELEITELNEHTPPERLPQIAAPLAAGESVGLISEAGAPAVADPGAELVAWCHDNDVRVKPMAGPSSILLALMASGLNGQSFAFNGYLPVKADQRRAAIRNLEKLAVGANQSQAFIETPYRNLQLFTDILASCRPQTRLCVASSIASADEFIRTHSIADWKKQPQPQIHKKPTVFIIL